MTVSPPDPLVGINLATGEFKFPELRDEIFKAEVLSNTEREMLRVHAAPAGPLWKLQRHLACFEDTLMRQLPNVNLSTELEKAIMIQAWINAIRFQRELMENQLGVLPESLEEPKQ